MMKAFFYLGFKKVATRMRWPDGMEFLFILAPAGTHLVLLVCLGQGLHDGTHPGKGSTIEV